MSAREYKLIVVGTNGVGKSALTIQFIMNKFIPDYDPTIEDSYRKQTAINGETCILDILDTAFQEEYSAMRDRYLRTGEGFILVYDITSQESLDGLAAFNDQVISVKDDEDVPRVLVGNKCDLEHERKVPFHVGQATAKEWGVSFVETSAKEGKNVDNVFCEVARLISVRYPKEQPMRRGRRGGCYLM
eukprot:TRINITY_DN2435_c0_g1_i3.p1 TRINITY_DN2435_c0_g1~~TRINITY_DN2435_c0_g1_i3.p1  ORF type:complete len:188 (+),score=33.67 TRINITY_DN2435_c0_g1_i3:66-629(+)